VRPFPHRVVHDRSLTLSSWRLSLGATRALLGAGGGHSITARAPGLQMLQSGKTTSKEHPSWRFLLRMSFRSG
jgi:hypothetical protein